MVNEKIRDKEVRVIDANGDMLGVMATKEAQKVAYSKNLDLVKIAPNANPPVCKVIDYGKYVFENNKRKKMEKKKQKVISVKELRLSPKIEEHDFGFKLKNASKFLKDGDKVKVSIRFRGREMHYTSTGKEVLQKFAKEVEDISTVEKRPNLEGRNMIMVLCPKKD